MPLGIAENLMFGPKEREFCELLKEVSPSLAEWVQMRIGLGKDLEEIGEILKKAGKLASREIY